MLKYIYDTEAEVPAESKGHYRQNGDQKWELDVQGAVPDSFRQKNIDLTRTADQVKGQLKPLIEVGLLDANLVPHADSIANFTRLKGIEQQLTEQKLVKSDKVDEAVATRTKAMQDEFDRKEKALNDTLKSRDSELARLTIDNRIIAEVTKHGAEAWAVEDLVRRGREKFAYEDGHVVPYIEKDGKREKDYGSKKGGLLTIEEWAETLPEKAPGYFKKSTGSKSGDGEGEGGGGGGQRNPYLKGPNGEPPNLTEQGKLEKSNPALATRFKAEAGK